MESQIIIPSFSGEIGNRLFQLFAAKYYSEIIGIPLRILESDSKETLFNLFPYLISVREAPKDSLVVEQPDCDRFVFKLFSERPNTSVVLKGLWQSYQYCSHTNLIPNWRNALKDSCNSIVDKAGLSYLDSQKETWMIYIQHDTYMELNSYYARCINQIPEGNKLHVFSDKPELCENFLQDLIKDHNLTVTWSKQVDDIATLYEMSYCLGGSILATSTLSWWGAFFARKRAINLGHKMRAYYPSLWNNNFPADLIPEWGNV